MLTDLIPTGRTITRAELARAANTSDREIRRAIHDLRMAGHPIVSHSSGRGYSMAADRAEIEAFCREQESRAMDLMAVAARMREAAEKEDNNV